MALNIKKIDSVSIRVRDLDKATKFYTETLGLPEIFRMDEMNLRGYGVGDNSASINIEPGKASMQLIIQVERVDLLACHERRMLVRRGGNGWH